MTSNQILETYTQIISALHRNWSPHDSQIEVGKALFKDDCRHLFIQCGRKWGKTELVAYFLWRWALSYPNASCYYIAPFVKQAKEIIWASRRLQNFGPKDRISGINNSELRITLDNDSFIKVDGSDNFEAYRGVNPHLVAYEEFKDFKPEFHEAMDPNLSTYNAPLVIIGTPPKRDGQYTVMAEESKKSPDKRFFSMPSWKNPHISKDWLSKKKKELYDRGEGDVWEREYGGKYIKGGAGSIFPMLSNSHMRPYNDIVGGIYRDTNKLQWFIAADPGNVTCFSVIFGCMNPYTKMIYILDEIYETDQKETSVNKIGARILSKKRSICKHDIDWLQVADEAATWFMVEMASRFDEGFTPTRKSQNKKDDGLSIIKDALLQDKLVISDRCVKLYWEMENYVKDRNGKIPKEDDHAIDCLRYSFGALGYELNSELEPEDVEERDKEIKRYYTPEDDWRNEHGESWGDIDMDSDYD